MMKILVSSCLLGNNCKYNGKNNLNQELIEYLKDYDIIPVCPECFGDLPIPRDPSEIKGTKVYSKSGKDVTQNFIKGANITLDIAKKQNCKIAILKKNSPSCGYGRIYDGTFSSKLIEGNGITADLLYNNGIVVLNEDNYKIDLEKGHE